MEFLVKDLLFVRYAPLFVTGMLLYRWHRYHHLSLADGLLLALSIGHCLVAYKAPFSYFVLGCHGVFALAVNGYLDRLAVRPLLWLGSLSYAVYLVHQNVGYGVIGWSYGLALPGWAGVGLALLMAFSLAAIIHYGIEKPALRWFRKMRKGREAKPAAPMPLMTARAPESLP